jgi:UDP-glucuronate 4-epimerase
MKIMVTGVAGFVGMHAAERLLARGDEVVGIDNVNDYYSIRLKRARLDRLARHRGFRFMQADIADLVAVQSFFADHRPDRVLHLAAQPGVRHSIKFPHTYVQSNLVGFGNVIECCRDNSVQHFVYASSSSVYGGNTAERFSENHSVDHPLSLYAATKKANELIAHTYSHLYQMPTTGLRFFTVYGPWGRPDMSPMLFADAITRGEAIQVFNHGDMERDFTYIDDIVEALIRVLDKPATPELGAEGSGAAPAVSSAPYRIFNIGSSQPVRLGEYIRTLEAALGRTAIKTLLPMQLGDVPRTSADTSLLEAWIHFRPATPLREGLARFAQWYIEHRWLL